MGWGFVWALALAVGGAALALWPVRVLEVVDSDRQQPVAVLPAGPFQLRYRHSLYGGTVWEQFRVVDTEIVLEAVEAEQEAALEYYGLPQRVTEHAGRYRLWPVGHRVRELVVRATATGQRTLVVGRWALPLYTQDPEGHRVRLRVARAPVARVAVHELRRWLPARGGAP